MKHHHLRKTVITWFHPQLLLSSVVLAPCCADWLSGAIADLCFVSQVWCTWVWSTWWTATTFSLPTTPPRSTSTYTALPSTSCCGPSSCCRSTSLSSLAFGQVRIPFLLLVFFVCIPFGGGVFFVPSMCRCYCEDIYILLSSLAPGQVPIQLFLLVFTVSSVCRYCCESDVSKCEVRVTWDLLFVLALQKVNCFVAEGFDSVFLFSCVLLFLTLIMFVGRLSFGWFRAIRPNQYRVSSPF